MRDTHLFKPLEGVGGEVVLLRMGQDILGERGEDGLKVGTLGSRSHIETIGNSKWERKRPKDQKTKRPKDQKNESATQSIN